MAINWSAYEAAKELYGTNKENIQDIGSRFPLFARVVMAVNDNSLLDILKALPKVSARVVESGLKGMSEDDETETKEVETDEEEENTSDYDSMNGKELYALCCERGISSLCKSRKKEALIELLEKLDNGEIKPSKKGKKASDEESAEETKKSAKGRKTSKKVEETEDDEEWDEEEEEETDPYAGKSAKELFKMCSDRGIKTKPKQSADAYVKLLKKADEAEAETEDEEDDEDDDWEI